MESFCGRVLPPAHTRTRGALDVFGTVRPPFSSAAPSQLQPLPSRSLFTLLSRHHRNVTVVLRPPSQAFFCARTLSSSPQSTCRAPDAPSGRLTTVVDPSHTRRKNRRKLARPLVEAPAAASPSATGSTPPNMAGGMALLGDRHFVEALIKAIGVIGASEIGDKTFFIAAVMAMRNSRYTVWFVF